MNNLAQGDDLTPTQRADRARAAFALYAAAYPGAEISDLITNLAHLADQEPDKCGNATLRDAAMRYRTELPIPEYRFNASELAVATAELLGDGWTANSAGAGVVSGPYIAPFSLWMDSGWCILFDQLVEDAFPEKPKLPTYVEDDIYGVYLTGHDAPDRLSELAPRIAEAIRAVTGYDPNNFDFTSSASRQHHRDTGRYLRKVAADSV